MQGKKGSAYDSPLLVLSGFGQLHVLHVVVLKCVQIEFMSLVTVKRSSEVDLLQRRSGPRLNGYMSKLGRRIHVR